MNCKKYLAKEIIYFYSIIIVVLIVVSIVVIRNHYLESRINDINNIQSLNVRKIDSLNGLFLSKDKNKQLIADLKKMSQQGVSEEDYKRYNVEFILRYGDKKKFDEINDIAKDQNKIKKEYLKIQNDYIRINTNEFIAYTFWFLLILVYPIRFSIILIIWSIKKIKEK